MAKNSRPRKLSVYLYIPNIIGYIRVLMNCFAFYTCFSNKKLFSVLYFVSFVCDALDGWFARKFNQDFVTKLSGQRFQKRLLLNEIYMREKILIQFNSKWPHEYIDDTEDDINIQLDNHRNQLIQLELFLSSGTVSLSIYSLVAGIFGMNIPYTWNDHYGYMFKWVVICAGAFCAIVFVFIISYARYKGLVGS